MALNYDFLPGLLNQYNNRASADQSALTPQDQQFMLNPESPDVPQYISNPKYKPTWADLMQGYNPNGAFNDKWIGDFANTPKNIYGVSAPTSGNQKDILDYMGLLNIAGGMRSGEQNSAFGTFMGDYGFALPMGAAAMAALATGAGFGLAGGAGEATGFQELPFGENGFLAGGSPTDWGLSALDQPGAGIGTGGYTGAGSDAVGSSNSWLSRIMNAPPGTGSALENFTKTISDGGRTITFNEGGTPGPLDILSKIFGGGGAGGSGMWGVGSSIASLLSGLFGSSYGRDIEKTATGLRNSTDSMMPVRPQAAGELLKLIADPSGIVNVPGYQSGLQAVDRSLAKQGFNPANTRGISGNFLNAQSEYGGKFYNDYMTQMAQLAGAQFNPAAAAALQLQGLEGGAGITGAGTQSTIAGVTGLLRNLPTIMSFFT